MKGLVAILLMVLMAFEGYSQVGINTSSPNAQLDVRSSNQATPSNTDGILIPKIDAFPVTNPTALQQGMLVYLTTAVGLNSPGFYYWDNATTTWIAIQGATDADWFEVGGTNSPDNTNDDMYHIGNVAIGKNTANYPLEVATTNQTINVNLDFIANTNGAERIGISNSISGTSNDDFSFVKNNVLGSGTGAKTGVYNDFQSLNSNKTGFHNMFTGGGAIGLNNDFNGVDSNDRYGTYTDFSSDGMGGNGTWFGHYVNFEYTTTTTNTGDKYGYSVIIPPSVGGTNLYGVYSYTGNLINGYAGYFSGRVSIGDTTLDTDHYILPISRGTAGQIMQTDGSGNVTWQNPNVAMNANFWSTTGNSGTNATTNFIGTTDDVDFVFRRNNVMSGIIGLNTTALGNSALFSNTTGADNTAIGLRALYSNTTGINNTAIGSYSLNSNNANYNTAIGSYSLYSNTSGTRNSVVGFQSAYYNTTGSYNTTNGFQALLYNSTGNYNTAIGSSSLIYNTTGYNNTATGANSLYSNTTGNSNIANGYQSLYTNTTGNNNVGIGNNALYSNTSGGNNIAISSDALYLNTTGSANIAIGLSALRSNTVGNSNSAIGYQSLRFNSSGNYNVALGTSTLYTNTTGSNNSALGFGALYSNTSGNSNTATGNNSLYFNTTGNNNVAMGGGSLYANTSGSNNAALGHYALGSNTTGLQNTAIGNAALRLNTTGLNNTASGAGALYSNTTGISNVASGSGALYLNSTGSYNTANGDSSLRSNTTGAANVAHGYYSLFSNTIGYGNSADGYMALRYNTQGDFNTASGHQSLNSNTTGNNNSAYGTYSLYNITTGSNNTGVGYNSLINVTTGTNNTAIGLSAYSAGNFTNSTALGSATNITASNQVRLGNATVTSIGGFANWTNVSDKRFKTNIQENVPGLSFITKLKPITYSLDLDAINNYLKIPQEIRIPELEIEKRKEIQTGFLAQDVEKVAKDLGYEFSGVDKPKNSEDYYGLRYAEFVVPLVKAVQEQQEIIESQNTKIQWLEERLKVLEEKLSK